MMKITSFLAASSLAFLIACNNNGATPKDAAPPHDAGIDTPSGPDADCIANPDMTQNDQIINACTSATKIYKDSHPPLTLPDGGLAPLP